ncbi:dephospho-CoA kinase [Arcticibacter tournemirensis]|uniref:Dephospho-CoA kinase n=1 Tax=Arcticibacter tournemirensis TaxID=699437 RepID=A0A4Q0MCP2_9SPHI|nr:dephospho-CoA kinase [Arcticibacter tournemirensis]KAA8486367.1 dephospho-CoA kinase [Arcticibacter tournemirensis]RXF71138.1 dephospho-CoA kinase [Arcticibacter tournemirensis]TQM52186.1 dephospho-CoA kinase [Arcticibacter tournemirensis]
MLKVGITGGIGSGKTTVCHLFELQGIPVFYADDRAKLLMNTDLVLVNSIKEAFGESVYLEDGRLNRKELARVVFNNAGLLEKLNSLVHPAVFRDFDSWSLKQKSPYVLKEAAILFESGSDKDCDFTILVTSPPDIRIRRVISRDKVSEEEVKKRMDKQLSDEKKIELADFIIRNDERELLIPQVINLHHKLLELSSVKTANDD